MRELNACRVIITMVGGSVFHGKINIGSSRRLSDYFRKNESGFIVLFDAAACDEEKEVYFLNRTHILWVKPDDTTCSPAGNTP